MQTFVDRLIDNMRAKKSVLVVGLDPQLRYMPPVLANRMRTGYGPTVDAVAKLFIEFNKSIIDATAEFAVGVKPQMAFYEAYGSAGIRAFEETVAYAREQGLVVIEDAKRGDGSDTADAYADGHIGEVPFWPEADTAFAEQNLTRVQSPLRVDCLTVHGYIADDCVSRFVRVAKANGTGIFVVDKTSFKPNSRVEQLETSSGLKVWQELAKMVDEWGQGTEGEYGYRNVGVVMGATYPEDAPWMRSVLPKSFFLVPGYGKQGGGAEGAVVAFNDDGLGCCVNSSRGIIYAHREPQYEKARDFATAAYQAARDARDELNAALRRDNKYAF